MLCRLLLVVLALSVPLTASAKVYECPDGRGGIYIQDAPCQVVREAPRPDPVPLHRDTPEALARLRAAEKRAQVQRAWMSEPLPSDYERQIDRAIAGRLKDPDSRRITITRNVGALVCGLYNARNGFGGYAGNEPFVALKDGNTMRVQLYRADDIAKGLHAEDALWLRTCGFQ